MDQYTKLLLHMNDTSFIDECGHSVTNVGALIDTTIKKFGSSSLKLTQLINQCISIPDSDDWHFENSDFTIDFQLYVNSYNGFFNILFEQRNSASENCPVLIYINKTGELIIYFSFDNVTGATVFNCGSLSTKVWHHIALIRNGSNFKIFIDGVQNGSTYTNSNAFTNKSAGIKIGGQNNSDTDIKSMDGNIDEFRISKGIARWTSNFTPPTKSYDSIRYLIKQNSNYYTIKTANYDSTTTHMFIPLALTGGSMPNDDDYHNFGFSDINLLNTNMSVSSDTFYPKDKFIAIGNFDIKMYMAN